MRSEKILSRLVPLLFRRKMSTADLQAKLDKIPNVDIDASGKFKYILVKIWVSSDDKEHYKSVVRGYASCPFHGDILEVLEQSLSKIESGTYDAECVGGGRILRGDNSIKVFGYSQGYGQADHTITVDILKKHFPSNYDISWSNEGY